MLLAEYPDEISRRSCWVAKAQNANCISHFSTLYPLCKERYEEPKNLPSTHGASTKFLVRFILSFHFTINYANLNQVVRGLIFRSNVDTRLSSHSRSSMNAKVSCQIDQHSPCDLMTFPSLFPIDFSTYVQARLYTLRLARW